MRHIRPVSVQRAQLFRDFAQEVRTAFNSFFIAKKNVGRPEDDLL